MKRASGLAVAEPSPSGLNKVALVPRVLPGVLMGVNLLVGVKISWDVRLLLLACNIVIRPYHDAAVTAAG
jgi:hypothetical protein